VVCNTNIDGAPGRSEVSVRPRLPILQLTTHCAAGGCKRSIPAFARDLATLTSSDSFHVLQSTMHFTSRTAFAAQALAVMSLFNTIVSAAPPLYDTPSQSSSLGKRDLSYSGCYSSADGLTEGGTYLYQSTSYCQQNICTGQQSVMGLTNGNDCFCGNSVPPASSKVDDSKCNVGCTGFGQTKCGGKGFYSVYLTGNGEFDASDPSSSSSSSPSSTQPVQIVVTSVAPGQTVVVTQPANSSSSSGAHSSGGGGGNTAGIAAGVVVGIVVLAAIIGGVYYYLRRRRQLAVEEEHRQRSQVSDFIAGGERKPLGSMYSHGSDARLDPEANALRRNSVGSFMADDSQDYSRKILRVANPDSS